MADRTYWESDLSSEPITQLTALYRQLDAPDGATLTGDWRGVSIGPAWLRKSTPASLGLIGFGDWFGKHLVLGAEGSINLFGPDGEDYAFPMSAEIAPSIIDERPCLVLRYDEDERWPWSGVLDELRALDPDHLLGQTQFGLPLVRGIFFPFMLSRVKN